jgi:hypothetical protein
VKSNFCLDSEELVDNVNFLLGEHEEVGVLEGMGNQESEKQSVQGLGVVSPISKDLNLVWKVKGTAGMSWEGQVGKLKQVFGQIVADKHGEGASVSAGVKADEIMGLRDDDISYAA